MSDLDWRLTWAQARQESLEDAWARNERSGALGVMQIMPSTAREIQRKLGINCWPYGNARCSIVMGSYYQGRMTNQFRRRERTPLQAWELGAASYNGGLGYVLSAQRECADARLWKEIKLCHPFAETRAYPRSIWNRYIIIVNQYPEIGSGNKVEASTP